MEQQKIECVLEGILFASGEPVSVERLSSVLAVSEEEIIAASASLARSFSENGRGIRLVKLENTLQLCSAPEYADYIRAALETRKPPKLTQTALEVLSIIAYFQPVTRAYIEQIRGTDSSYTVSALADKGLIEPCGHLDAPGRPTLFKTTSTFLRTFGLESIEDLPALPDSSKDEEQLRVEKDIEMLSAELSQAEEESKEL